ncbi:MAG TPA: PQQ-binding-like beta-propeller repeat protein [Gemmatimonadaceae bacterium]
MMSRRSCTAGSLRRVTRRGLGVALTLVAAVTVGSTRGGAQTDSTWRDHERALQAARAANDTVAYRAHLDAVYRHLGATPRIAARFAALALGAHDEVAATRWMGAIAAMGAGLDSGLVAQYAALEGQDARASLLALRVRATSDVGAPEVVFRLPDTDMISEDIAYDAARSVFLVSSVRNGRVYAKRSGVDAPAIVMFGGDRGWGTFALGVDSSRGVLWATSAAVPMTAQFAPADSGCSALLELDLSTGRPRGRYVAPDSGAHTLGDVTVARNGAVYVADGLGSGVYALDAGRDSLRVLVPRGVFASPQTPALSADGATLFVPDYSIGIAAVDIATGRVAWITHSDSLALTGIDGMYRVGHDLIVVQNGLEPNRIARLALDATMRRVVHATTLVRGSGAVDLNHAAIVGDWIYFISKSGWERVADDGTMRKGATGDAPTVARMRLAP